MDTADAFARAVDAHDEAIARSGMSLWVGSEPTFTDRQAHTPEWLSSALGGDKEARAQALAQALVRRLPGAMIVRSTGRLYPGEAAPRWCIGLYRRHDGEAFWSGPPDPLLTSETERCSARPEDWAGALAAALTTLGWPTEMAAEPVPEAEATSAVFRVVAQRPEPGSVPLVFLLGFADLGPDGARTARIELPELDEPALGQTVLEAVAGAARAAGLPSLVIAGAAPPTDDCFELTTITPDPAVIELNAAPNAHAGQFLWRSRQIYDCAAAVGLAPFRLYFNGTVADSGGGGHITLGGPSPRTSPFILQPRLVLRLVRYFNHHPALSYLFAHDFVGSSGISVRPDERGADAFDELVLELELLDRCPQLTPDRVWQGLAPFLCDVAGNSHRAELNIEKLWNPFLHGRGRLGLIEFRALRMPHSAERATALACLLRAIVAMLARAPVDRDLIDWGRDLHERCALPFYLERDLLQIFGDLSAAGLGLGAPIEEVLRQDEFRLLATVPLPGCHLELRRALEFWPLLGDAASAEQGGSSRLIDASCARLELRLRPEPASCAGAAAPILDWRAFTMWYGTTRLPLRPERDAAGELMVYGLRYRSFPPEQGLHPLLGAQVPLTLRLRHPGNTHDWVVAVHEWEPQGAAYPGLPDDLADAERRRRQRIVVRAAEMERDGPPSGAPAPGPRRGIGAYCIDLRWPSAADG